MDALDEIFTNEELAIGPFASLQPIEIYTIIP